MFNFLLLSFPKHYDIHCIREPTSLYFVMDTGQRLKLFSSLFSSEISLKLSKHLKTSHKFPHLLKNYIFKLLISVCVKLSSGNLNYKY